MCVRCEHAAILPVLPTGWPPNLLMHLYLLHVHGVRTRPSGGDEWALFVEPPAVASRRSVEMACAALRDVVELVSAGEAMRLRQGALGAERVAL